MSIALESVNTSTIRMGRPLFHHRKPCASVYDHPPDAGGLVFGMFAGGQHLQPVALHVMEELAESGDHVDSTSSSSSSIGINSDSSDGEHDSAEAEVQSSYKGPLDALEALEEVLPIKRSVSQFYRGKSKSFAILSQAASCSSINEIVKPENAYTRKRRNLLAYSIWDKKRDRPLRSSKGGISKKPASRSTLALAVSMSILGSQNNYENLTSSSSSPIISRPPLYPHNRRSPHESLPPPSPRNLSPWRSLSLSDLHCVEATNIRDE